MAAVAQLVERQIVALNVAGSIPVGRPKFPILFFSNLLRFSNRISNFRRLVLGRLNNRDLVDLRKYG
jgi:hypothetical protein